ncbi:hypothetical protein U1Q18_007615, partial [Sarracenia purpurea var. burkii]
LLAADYPHLRQASPRSSSRPPRQRPWRPNPTATPTTASLPLRITHHHASTLRAGTPTPSSSPSGDHPFDASFFTVAAHRGAARHRPPPSRPP